MVKKITDKAESATKGAKSTINWGGLLKRVPMPAKTSDTSEALRRELVHAHLISLLTSFSMDESLVTTLHNYAASKLLTKQKISEDRWSDQYTKLYRTPKSWMCMQLIRVSDGTFTAELLGKIDKRDAEAISTLWFMFHQVSPTDPWHEALLDKSRHDRFWDERHEQIGSWAKGWPTRGVNADGSINWKDGGAYRIIMSNAGVEVKHIGGDSYMLPPMLAVTREFEVHHPHDHLRAQLRDGIVKVDLADGFKAGTGPHRHNVKAGSNAACSFAQLVAKYADEASTNAATSIGNAKSATAVKKALAQTEAERKAALAARAKEAALRRKAARSKTFKLANLVQPVLTDAPADD